MEPLWGIDLGGTKVEGVIMADPAKAEPLLRIRLDTESRLGYEHVIGRIKELVEKMMQESGLRPGRIGIGTPGELDPILRVMKNANSVVLNGKPLKADLEQALGIPFEMANDANCFALAETHWGAVARGFPEARMVFGVIAGTGVGGGIVLDGKVWNGKHGIGGEWGHNFLDESGGPCYCGKVGCVETVIAGPALERYYAGLTGKPARLKEIVTLASTGQPEAKATMDRLYHFFGKALSVVTNILDPDVIVVGGGVGNIPGLYTEGIEALKQFIFNNTLDVPVVAPLLGDSAGVFGAAALTLDPQRR
jgi:predicted NBD/HSP70 family sugar kinase